MLGNLYLKGQVTQFVMLFVGRVGSTYLTGLIGAHPNVRAMMDSLSELKDVNEQLQWAREALTPPTIGKFGAVGFKTKPANVIDIDAFTRLVKDRNCKILQLTRRNRVKAVISHLNGKRLAEATGMWGLFDEDNRPKPFSIDPVEFNDVLKHRETVDKELEQYVKSLALPTLAFHYEDLLVNEPKVLTNIFSFLGVPEKPVNHQ
jgi:hypothetical protein